jgi:hypothetical protein
VGGKASKIDVARRLARAHYTAEGGLVKVYLLVSKTESEAEPIKLLEVNRSTIPTGIMPLRFDAAPARGIPYPSIIVEVTPDEFEKIQQSALKLPDGWLIGEEIPNDEAAVAPDQPRRGGSRGPGKTGKDKRHR